jgi:hypothetical protein
LGTNYNSVLWIVLGESEGVLCPGKKSDNKIMVETMNLLPKVRLEQQ